MNTDVEISKLQQRITNLENCIASSVLDHRRRISELINENNQLTQTLTKYRANIIDIVYTMNQVKEIDSIHLLGMDEMLQMIKNQIEKNPQNVSNSHKKQ